MTACTFAEFFEACKHRLTNEQLRLLGTRDQYFKLKDGYCGLLIEPERVWVSILVGGIKDIWHLRRVFIKAGMPLVGWKCRPNSPMHKIALYYSGVVEKTDQFYPDGSPTLRCLIHPKQTRRVKNTKAESQALI